jgi:hypothetical protein
MTNTARMAHAAHVMAEALEVLTPTQRDIAIECALKLCPKEAIAPPAPPKKRRSDAGKKRTPAYTTEDYVRENVPERE